MKKVIGIVLVLVAAVCVTAGPWYMHVHQKQRVRDTATSPAPPAPSTKVTYLSIPEWGVRFALPADLQGDITYGIRKNVNLAVGDASPPLYGDVAYFASKKLAALNVPANNCGLKSGAFDDLHQRSDPTSYDGGPGVSLERTKVRQTPELSSDMAMHGYWFRITKGSTATCYEGSDGSQEPAFIMSAQRSLRNLEIIPPH